MVTLMILKPIVILTLLKFMIILLTLNSMAVFANTHVYDYIDNI